MYKKRKNIKKEIILTVSSNQHKNKFFDSFCLFLSCLLAKFENQFLTLSRSSHPTQINFPNFHLIACE